MATIDDKVVALSFEASKFESGVNSAIRSLDKLKSSLKLENVGKGLESVQNAIGRFNLGRVGDAVESVSHKFDALRLVAISVLGQLAAQATRAAGRFIKAFTLGPIIQGLDIYQTKLQSVQTVLANTSAQGTKLKDVNKALQDLNKYSNQTIYNFGQMAKNIGTFTAAGVDLKTSTEAIKGIANLAALSGSSADQASMAMYQLSQAIASGRVSLQDWNSVVNAGMGGATFQKALAQTAEAMGALKKGSVELVGPMKQLKINGESFRQSIGGPGPKWLTSDILTTTLKNFTGDMTKAQLKAEGFNDAQIKAIQKTATVALHAATQVKTFSQLLDIAKETAATGWATTWELVLGNFGEAKKTFTDMSNAINGFIQRSSDARNKVLADWKALGGRTVLIEGLKSAFHDLAAVVKPIGQAFRDIFPATTGKQLFDLTTRFKNLMDSLRPSAQTVEGIRSTFRGLFAVMDIGKQIVQGIFTVFGQLFHALSGGQGGFLKFTGSIGDFLVALDNALKKGDALHNFFLGLGTILAAPLKILQQLAGAIGDLFSGFSSGGFSSSMSGATKALTPFGKIMQAVSDAWAKFLASFGNAGSVLQPAIDGIVKLIQGLGTALGQAATNMNFDAILSVIRTGLFGALVVMFKQFLGKGSLIDQIGGLGGGIIKNIAGSFDALRGSMVAMQQNIKAKTLKEIAIAVGILVASLVALSFVDPKKISSSLATMTIAFGELLGAMAILDKIGKSGGFIKLPIIAGALILLATAIDILTLAVLALSRLSWEGLIKGLGGVAVLLTAISAASIPLSANSAGMIRAGVGITAIAIALNILARAVSSFGGMSFGELGKGLGSVAAGLAIMAVAAKALPPGLVLQGAGLIAVATGLRILAGAVQQFGGMNWGSIAKGLVGIGGALVVIAGAMRLMPGNMVVTAAGLLLVSLSLGKIAAAVQSMGGMSIKQIAKGLGTLAGALILLAAAMYAMSGTLGGAAAIAVAAAGLSLLAPAIVTLGKQSWGQIIKGLVTLGAALAIIGVAGALMTPVIPSLLGLGAALLLIGGGLALAGAGIALIGAGLSALVVALPTGIGVLIAALIKLTEAIPALAKNLIQGFLAIVQQLATVAPQFVDAIVKILGTLIDAIIKSTPKIQETFNLLLIAALQTLKSNEPRIIQAGFDLLTALLNGIKNNIGQLVSTIVNLITRILTVVASNLGRIITAGLSILTSLVKGIASGYAQVLTAAITIVTKFLTTIASNLGKIVTAGLSILTSLLRGIANAIGQVITAGVNVIVKFIQGIGNAGPRVISAGVDTIIKLMNSLEKNGVKLVNAGVRVIINFINGVANGIEANAPALRNAGLHLGYAIIDGMSGGILGKAGDLYSKIEGVMSHAKSLMGKAFSIFSPSKVTMEMGQLIIDGFVIGLDKNAGNIYKSVENISYGLINGFKNIFQITSPSKVMEEIGQQVGGGFAQGLRGSTDDIKKAFVDMNKTLTDAMAGARKTIAEEQKKLNELRAANKPDAEAIKAAQDTIKENQAILAQSTVAHSALTGKLQAEKKELLGLVTQYNAITDRIQQAQDAIKTFTDQYNTLPSIVTEDAEGNAIDQLATYEEALKHQADAISAYQSTLDQLRKLGLDDATYQKLLTEGTADQQFASQLLAGGKTAVQSLNTLDTQLQNVSKSLAVSAAKNLYGAGVDAAQGLLKGLQSQRQRLHQEAEDIANDIIRTIKKALEVKSPSAVMAEIGVQTIDGLIKGFRDSSVAVVNAAEDIANSAVTAMQKSMSGLSDVVMQDIDVSPVITPILDLTQVKVQSQELAALTAVPLTTTVSLEQASTISAQTGAQAEEAAAAVVGPSIKYEQNNYSPTALTEIEIYRQTRNQLSQLKSVLALS